MRKRRGTRKTRAWVWLAAAVSLGLVIAATSVSTPEIPVTERDADLVTLGQDLYFASCAACHGPLLEGTDTGPSFIDSIYAPNHHGDEAFQRAVLAGTQPHHWNFGPMPPQADLNRADVMAIVAFVRTQQEAAGVFVDPTH